MRSLSERLSAAALKNAAARAGILLPSAIVRRLSRLRAVFVRVVLPRDVKNRRKRTRARVVITRNTKEKLADNSISVRIENGAAQPRLRRPHCVYM